MVTNLHIFKTILLTDASKDILLTALLHLTGQKQFIKDEVGLLEIEDNV